MKTIRAILVAALAAIAVQPLVMWLWMGIPPLLMGVHWRISELQDLLGTSRSIVIIATPFVFLIGIPIMLLLKRFGQLRLLWLAAIGFAVAALPIAFMGFPTDTLGYSSGGNFWGRAVSYYVDGKPTIWGWLSYVQGIIAFGLHGFMGASVFYRVLQRMGYPTRH